MSIFSELNRRNVFRVALLYFVAAWLILQLIDILFDLAGIPAWAFRFAFALLLICFPLVLIFSWIFEITPQGIRREQDIEIQKSITAQTGRKLNRIIVVLLTITILVAVADRLIHASSPEPATQESIDLQGHRGARGLLPENSIPALLHALNLGVTTLEMDVAINAQGHPVLSHEPWMSARICSHGDGRAVSEEEQQNLRIYTMSDAEVAGYDCGSRGHPDFPGQQHMPVAKPLLGDALRAVARRSSETGRAAVYFNIEIKSAPEGDRVFHPEVDEFVAIVYQLLKEHGVVDRSTIQSFDPRALQAVHALDPGISTAWLVDNEDDFGDNLQKLDFAPDIYSPHYSLVNKQMISAAHALNIRVVPWTVNEAGSMQHLLDLGVDGLITDYPDLGIEVLSARQQQ